MRTRKKDISVSINRCVKTCHKQSSLVNFWWTTGSHPGRLCGGSLLRRLLPNLRFRTASGVMQTGCVLPQVRPAGPRNPKNNIQLSFRTHLRRAVAGLHRHSPQSCEAIASCPAFLGCRLTELVAIVPGISSWRPIIAGQRLVTEGKTTGSLPGAWTEPRAFSTDPWISEAV